MIRVHGIFQKQLKNRSSKNLYCLTKRTPAVRSMSNAALAERAKTGDKEAIGEQERRAKREGRRPKSTKAPATENA